MTDEEPVAIVAHFIQGLVVTFPISSPPIVCLQTALWLTRHCPHPPVGVHTRNTHLTVSRDSSPDSVPEPEIWFHQKRPDFYPHQRRVGWSPGSAIPGASCLTLWAELLLGIYQPALCRVFCFSLNLRLLELDSVSPPLLPPHPAPLSISFLVSGIF